MKLHEHFLKEDLEQASKEFHCSKECLELTFLHVKSGNIILAKKRIEDVKKSLEELSNLSKKKTYVDCHKELTERLAVEASVFQAFRRFISD